MVHQKRTPNQLPDELLAIGSQLPAPAVEFPESSLQAPAQRAREHAAPYRAAEAPREPAERAQQARGDVVCLGRREVQQVRERVVERGAREEPVDEHDGHVQRERRVLRRRRGQDQEAEAEEQEAEDGWAPEAAGAADVEGLGCLRCMSAGWLVGLDMVRWKVRGKARGFGNEGEERKKRDLRRREGRRGRSLG